MLQSQSHPNNADAVDANQKTIAAIAISDVANPKSVNIVDPEQQVTHTQTSRSDKSVIRLAKPGILFQAISTIPSFAVELNYGIKYADQCPIQPLIIVFLIVHGCSSLANGIVLALGYVAAKHVQRSSNPSPNARRLVAGSLIGQLVLLIFSIVWLVVGQVWVFGAQVNGFQSTNATQTTTYCNSTVFWTGFAIIIVTYAVWLIIILVVVVRFLIKRHKSKQEIAATTDQRI